MATAATPKRSFKRTVASTVEGRSPRFLLGSLALAMVISLLAGLGIGVKIGEHGKTTTKTSPVVKPTPTTKKPVKRTSAFAQPPLKGVVVRSLPKLLVVSRGKTRIVLTMLPNSRIEVTRPASRSDIKVGSHVLFVLGTKATGAIGTTTTGAAVPGFVAKQVLIISGANQNRMGSLVSAVTADSMSFKAAGGKSVTISTVGADVKTTIPGTRAKLTPGRHVLVKSFLFAAPKPKKQGAKAKATRKRVVVEVVVLPGDSLLG